jgi:hypothetical protein
MSNLKEFLSKQAAKQNVGVDQRDELRREWIEAVQRLMGQLEGWLRETDTEGALRIEPTAHRIGERKIGSYEAKGLRITLDSPSLAPREIGVEPIARFAIGSFEGDPLGKTIRDGRVDMTNYEKKYYLYRRKSDDGDEWVMVDDRDYRAQPLDREHFEAVVQSMLEQ